MYLVPDDLMEAFVASTAMHIDEPIMFRKGPASLIDGLGEVYQEFMLLTIPQGLAMGDLLGDDEPDAYGDAQQYVEPAPIPDLGEDDRDCDEGHTCDCE